MRAVCAARLAIILAGHGWQPGPFPRADKKSSTRLPSFPRADHGWQRAWPCGLFPRPDKNRSTRIAYWHMLDLYNSNAVNNQLSSYISLGGA
ncbi:hypothetical protein FIBSPDRAFT_853612 [Athelia psychrophila]|uniref:Uncharacterized protein n=1 Tax=Athelia psychrophila TaxID=1759441 RepID=A0A166QQ73_9AGAM|nr:hypothetical protein FIBSPDRAFT_853612 [Fibularhizoctonia sp. CBS 109695]